MLKNKINYNLVNTLLIMAIIYIIVITSPYWGGIINKVIEIITPFFLAFVFAYILDPFVKKLESKNVRRSLSLLTVIFSFFLIVVLLLWITLPSIYDQLIGFSKTFTTVLNDLEYKFNLSNFGELQDSITDGLNGLIKNVASYISTGTIDVVGKSVNFITNGMVVIIVGIYFLVDMDKIRKMLRKLLRKQKKIYNYLKALDNQMGNYLTGLSIFMLVQLIEYSLIFKIVGHPSWLLLGVLACVTTVIPYFGGIFTNIIAILTASVISTRLLICTIIITLIFPNIDGYVISPHIYGKTNNINPILVIFTAGVCSKLFGIFGFMMGLPLYLVLRTTWNFFSDDIKDYIEDRKEENKA